MKGKYAGSFVDDAMLYQLAEQFVGRMQDRQLKFATAESCSGGWIAKAITDVAGCSDIFEGAVVTYSNDCKIKLLNVPKSILEVEGAVSEGVVKSMALGVSLLMAADLSVAVSGVAGPGGGTKDKPVGTVWIGWHMQGESVARKYHFAGDREQVRRLTVYNALLGAFELLSAQ